jgi:hypothetical protein
VTGWNGKGGFGSERPSGKARRDKLNSSSAGTLPLPERLFGREAPSMSGQHQFSSVAAMMRKQPSPAEAHLIKPAWSPRIASRTEGRPRAN